MSYILLYDERYGYFESFHNGYDGDYHIEVFTVEG